MRAHLNQRALVTLLLFPGVVACATQKHVPPPGLAELGLAERYDPASVDPSGAPNAAPLAAPLPEVPASRDLARWWESFGDPVLDGLIERGNAENLDVQAAALAGEKRGASHHLATNAGSPTLDAVKNQVQASIARRYIALRGRQMLIADDRDFLVQQQALIQLAGFRAQAGLVSPLDAARAVASRDDMLARIADLEAQNERDVGQIAMLTGQVSQALGDLLAGTAQIPVGPADVAIGSRSDLLIRRADIRAAAARLAASGGRSDEHRRKLIDYRRAVLQAVQEVEMQNTAFQRAKLHEIDLGRAQATAGTAALLARKAYADGLADYSTLDQVETRLLSSRAALRQAQVQRAIALIGLYVALGGDPGTPGPSDPVQASPKPLGNSGG